MWALYAILLINLFCPNSAIISERWRINVAGLPINIIDAGLYIALLACFLPRARRYIGTQMHPAAVWGLCLFILALIGGAIGALSNTADTRQIATCARNLIACPMCLFIGVRLLPRLKSLNYFVYAQILGGAIVAVLVLIYFRDTAIEEHQTNVIDIRIGQFISGYAGLAAAVLLFTLGSAKLRLFPKWLTVLLIGLCTVGSCATLDRSEWIALALTFASTLAIMPRKRVVSIIGVVLMTAIGVGLSVWIAIISASRLTETDVGSAMVLRIESLLPGEHEGIRQHAWDTRLRGTLIEIGIFLHSPLIGGGFGIQDVIGRNEPEHAQDGFRHNTWVSTLAETGLIGFSAMALVAGSMFVAGRRLIRARLSKGTMLIGALGFVTAVHWSLLGVMTMTFNQMRPAIIFALTCGLVLRARQLQLAVTEVYGLDYDPVTTSDEDAPQLDDAAVAEGEMAYANGIVETEVDADEELEAYHHPATR